MNLLYCALCILFSNIYSSDFEYQTTTKTINKVSFVKEFGRVIAAMPYTTELYQNVRLIYNDPSITKCGSYQPLDNDGIIKTKEDTRTTAWYPNFTKKTQGSPVVIEGKPIYYKMYMPEGIPLKAMIFDIYGGSIPRYDAIFGWYFNARVLASQGYGVAFLSLSDVQDKTFPTSQTNFNTAHFNLLKNEIKTFLIKSFSHIKANGCKNILSKARTAPHFLMGTSFGGLLTLKCATDPAFLKATNKFLDGFIAQAPSTYQLRYKTSSKYIYSSPISTFDDLTKIPNAQLDHTYSPVSDASNLQKPVLLMHSHYDMRVPLDHSLRFYDAARKAGKENFVFLWVDEQEARHAPITPSTGTLQEAKIRVNREVKVVEQFIDTKQLASSSYERWFYAYPKSNNTDSIGNGLNPIKQDNRNELYRTAVKELSASSLSEKDIETYAQKKVASKPLNYLLMYNLLMQKSETISNDTRIKFWDSQKFKQQFCQQFPDLHFIGTNLNDCLKNNPFVINLPTHYGKKLALIRKAFGYTVSECTDTVAHALLEIYIEGFYELFGKSHSTDLKQELEKQTRDQMQIETFEMVSNLKKIFPIIDINKSASSG